MANKKIHAIIAVLLMMAGMAHAQTLSQVKNFNRTQNGTYTAVSESDQMSGVAAWQYLEAKEASYLINCEGQVYLATTVKRKLLKVESSTLTESEDSAVVKFKNGEMYADNDLRWTMVQPDQTVVHTVFFGYINRGGVPYAAVGEWYSAIKDENIGNFPEIALEGKPLAESYVPSGARVVVISEDVAKTLLPESSNGKLSPEELVRYLRSH